jgi:NADH-dependent peroxiredoxin subunit F
MYDSIIIGAGPAGLTAALYLIRKKMNFLLITEDVGGQTAMSGEVENYPGYKSITGVDLITKIQEQIKALGVSLVYEKVKSIERNNNIFKVVTEDKKHLSKTVIVASGKLPKKLGVSGEEKFTGRGVAYCATCDAPNFKNLPVAVVGGGNSALDAVLQLSNYAKQIYLININDSLTGDAIMQEKVRKLGMIKILNNKKTLSIKGKQTVSVIEIEDTKTNKKEKIKVSGVFINIGWYSSTQFEMPVKLNEQKEIIVDKNCLTNTSGFFAAGDVTDIKSKQTVIAAGEGAKAALSVYSYLIEI